MSPFNTCFFLDGSSTVNLLKSFICIISSVLWLYCVGSDVSKPSNRRPNAERPKARSHGKPPSARQKRKNAEARSRGARDCLGLDLTTNAPLFPGENHAAYVALHEEMKRAYRPDIPPHVEVVARAADLIWRLRRIPALEAAVFSATARSLASVGIGEIIRIRPAERRRRFGCHAKRRHAWRDRAL